MRDSSALQEKDWVEWKVGYDLTKNPGRASVAKHLIGFANRDPAANPHPERFDAGRAGRRSFTFGAGPHACPGEALAATIAAAGVEALLRSGVEPARLARAYAYRPSANARIPIFG